MPATSPTFSRQHPCYCRESKYYAFEDVHDFAYRIQVKENAPDLLRRALSRVPVDLAGTGDYQPAERKYGLSRQVLEAWPWTYVKT